MSMPSDVAGWQDKYGVSWQVVPAELGLWMSDPGKSGLVMGETL